MDVKDEKSEIKKRIHTLKAKRDDALGRKASQEVAKVRRGIRSLKRRSRELARAAKAQAPAAAAPAPAA